MWERFSFYGMRVLLIFYLTQHFLFEDSKAILIVGSYNALVNASPLLGGVLADRYLGFKKAVIVGAIFMLMGHMGIVYEGSASLIVSDTFGNQSIHRDAFAISVFYFSLGLLVVGVGFLKPSISCLVGSLYSHSDRRRESGFTIFTMGINLGATIAAIICGYLGQTYGWAYGFGSAAVAMVIGLSVFLFGQNTLRGYGNPPDTSKLRAQVVPGVRYEHLIYIGAFLLVLAISSLLYYPEAIGSILFVLAAVCAMWLLWFGLFRSDKIQRDRIIAFVLLLAFIVGYVVLIEQVSTSLNLFIDRNVDRTIGDVTLQASQIYAVLPSMTIVFAPILAWLWAALAKTRLNPPVPLKFVFGFLLIGLAYYLVVLTLTFSDSDNQMKLIWIIIFFVLVALSDLFVIPIAIASVTLLAPKQILGLMMGIYFFAISAANYLAALAASTASIPDTDSNIIDTALSMELYTDLFTNLAIFAVILASVLLILVPLIRKLAH